MARAGPSVASLLSQLDLGSYATKLGDLGYKFASFVAQPLSCPNKTAHAPLMTTVTAGT